MDDLYDIKLKGKGIVKSVTKLLLNSTFGRFGMSIIKPVTEIVDTNRLDSLLITHKVLETKQISLDTFIVNYESELSQDIIHNLGLNYSKILNNMKDIETNEQYSFVSISTAAAITAYGRIYINKIKLLILKLGGVIYYSDTDSIVTNIQLPDELVGKELGKFKLEYKLKRAIFITSKTYMLELEDGHIITKAKGVNIGSLKKNDFENMYFKSKDATALKTQSNLEFSEGTVNIYTKSTRIRYDSYIKREKIYNKEGLWIDTKPIIFNNTNLNPDKSKK